jgi:hypothetical protein
VAGNESPTLTRGEQDDGLFGLDAVAEPILQGLLADGAPCKLAE